MRGWLNWRALEKHNVWGVRRKDDEEAATWSASAAQWEQRAQREGDAARKQVEALTEISPEDSVLEVGCGTGPMTVWLARKARCVTAQDFSAEMLDYVRQKAEAEKLDNISLLQGNWFSMEPDVDFPKHDIAVARHAPCQSDIVKFSRCAKKYCYSLWNCAPAEREAYTFNPGIPTDPKTSPHRRYNEPNGRLFGYNVHFNILYDLGANPTLEFVTQERTVIRERRDEVLDALFGGQADKLPGPFRERMEANIVRQADGSFCFRQVTKMSILGWDPNELHDADIEL